MGDHAGSAGAVGFFAVFLCFDLGKMFLSCFFPIFFDGFGHIPAPQKKPEKITPAPTSPLFRVFGRIFSWEQFFLEFLLWGKILWARSDALYQSPSLEGQKCKEWPLGGLFPNPATARRCV